jgi:hypothetical protein
MTTPMLQKIHGLSEEIMSPALELFTVPPTNLQIEKTWSQEYYPVAPLENARQIEVNVLGSTESYIDLSKTLLEIHAKIVNGDGTDLAAGVAVTPIPNFLHSLFSQVDVYLGNKLVSKSQDMYPYVAYIQNLLNNRNSVQNEQYDTELFIKDTAGYHDAQDNVANTGASKRRAYFAGSATVDMIGKLHSDLFESDRYLVSSLDMKVVLTRSKNEFCLFAAAAGATFKVIITKAILHVTNVKVSAPLILAQAAMLQSTTAKYPLSPVEIKASSFPANLSHISIENLILGQIPNRIIIGLVSSDAFLGNYGRNPFNFQHFNLSLMGLYVNGELVSNTPYQPDFANNRYCKVYKDFMDAVGVWNKDRTCGISRADYKNGYTLYAFDLSPDKHGDGHHFSLMRTGTLRLDCRFSQALPNAIHVVCIAEYENLLEVDANRTIAFDYSG